MTNLWTTFVPRLLGVTLLGFGIWFIPRNWWRLAKTRPGGRWPLRRVWYLVCWTIIVMGYLAPAVTLLCWGWRYALIASIEFAMSMLAFIPVPCHYSIFNTQPLWRFLRAVFFVLVAGGAVAVSGLL